MEPASPEPFFSYSPSPKKLAKAVYATKDIVNDSGSNLLTKSVDSINSNSHSNNEDSYVK